MQPLVYPSPFPNLNNYTTLIDLWSTGCVTPKLIETNTGRERLIRSHSSARFYFELSGISN